LLPRGQLAGELLVEELQSHGAVVEPIVVYNTVRPDGPDIRAITGRLMNHEIDVVTFASPSAVYNFVEMMEESSISDVFKHTRIAVIGPTTEEAVRAVGLQADIVAHQATSEGLAEAINNSL
jgi:uroporphyrinogen-III synthase